MSELHVPQAPAYTHALRISFAYDGDKITLAGSTRVAMRVPAPATPPPDEKQAGYWLEVRGRDHELLYHRPIHDPLQRDVEVFGDEPGGPLRRTPSRRASGSFEVLIPDLPAATQFILHGPAAGAEGALTRSVPLASLSLDELRKLAAEAARGGRP
jgi:hypothetical protein